MLLLNALTGALAFSVVTVSPLANRTTTNKSTPSAHASAESLMGQTAYVPTDQRDTADFEPRIASRAWRAIVLHHSATSGGSVDSIDTAHRRQEDSSGKAWLGIGYHFVVGNGRPMADGEIQPTFRWVQQLPGAHAGRREYNDDGIGVCLIGNFEETPPTERQVAAVGNLLSILARRYAIPRERIVGHHDVQATRCPGRLFPLDELLAAVPREQPF